jgi:membrane peptidoglycan carboxypeptidase
MALIKTQNHFWNLVDLLQRKREGNLTIPRCVGEFPGVGKVYIAKGEGQEVDSALERFNQIQKVPLAKMGARDAAYFFMGLCKSSEYRVFGKNSLSRLSSDLGTLYLDETVFQIPSGPTLLFRDFQDAWLVGRTGRFSSGFYVGEDTCSFIQEAEVEKNKPLEERKVIFADELYWEAQRLDLETGQLHGRGKLTLTPNELEMHNLSKWLLKDAARPLAEFMTKIHRLQGYACPEFKFSGMKSSCVKRYGAPIVNPLRFEWSGKVNYYSDNNPVERDFFFVQK